MRAIWIGLLVVAAIAAVPGGSRAGEFTNVIDAFDKEFNGDPFDLNLSVGYERVFKAGDIRRESFDPLDVHEWDYYGYVDVARYKQTTHLLNLQLDIGLFHDISVRTTLPIVLSDSRSLSRAANFDWSTLGAGQALFSPNFKSPNRSGLDTLNVGLWWGILDQERDETKPNWTVYLEGRFSVGKEMRAACKKIDGADGNDCQYTDRDTGDVVTAPESSGAGRGVHEVLGGFRLSRRYKIVEPYFGLEALIGFSKGGNDFFISNNSGGMLNTRPPAVGTIDIGMELVPWEVPEKQRKLIIGVGTGGKYHSEGRDRTPLYDALGTSDYFLGDQEFVDFDGDGQNDGGQEISGLDGWSGTTDVENYATIFGKVFIAVQPAKYVKLRIGSHFMHETEHFITKTDQCSASNIDGGVCNTYNWGYRPELDIPGSRFRAEKTFVWDFFIDAIAQF